MGAQGFVLLLIFPKLKSLAPNFVFLEKKIPQAKI